LGGETDVSIDYIDITYNSTKGYYILDLYRVFWHLNYKINKPTMDFMRDKPDEVDEVLMIVDDSK